MHELAKVTLENEMDLILAHRRSMKLAELAGLSLSAQTTFATAVSEVSRNIIDSGKMGLLVLGVDIEKRNKYIVASLQNGQSPNNSMDGLEYAKRLVDKYKVYSKGSDNFIDLYYHLHIPFIIDIHKLDEWRTIFRNEPPVSAYEELKRKNEQLQDLSERIQKSEAQYKTLTNSLPLMIFSVDTAGQILYANEWLSVYTGQSITKLNETRWKNVVHEEDYESSSSMLSGHVETGSTIITAQLRLKKNNSDYFWHQVSLSPFKNDKDELLYWIGYIVDIHAQKVFEETLRDNIELKQTQEKLRDNQYILENYIDELNRSNRELQQFAFVASHDLQEPVRKILYYSDYLLSRNAEKMDQKTVDFLTSMQAASQRMRNLIHDLLFFSQINKDQLKLNAVDLNVIANDAVQDLEIAIEEKNATINIQRLPVVRGDERMMRQLFENIINNSLKYSNPMLAPVIDISCKKGDSSVEIAFKDNGIGFDEKYLPQMFTLFQRLHSRENYEGTGLGLAICRRIVEIHQGKIWAEGREGLGATFFVSLQLNHPAN